MNIYDALEDYLRQKGLHVVLCCAPAGKVDSFLTVTNLQVSISLFLYGITLCIRVPHPHEDMPNLARVVERLDLANPSTTPEFIESRVRFHAAAHAEERP